MLETAPTVIEEFARIVGAAHVLDGSDARAEPHLVDFWGRQRGRALCIIRPASTEEVSAVVALCHREGIAVFPQGGNTSSCFGATPDAGGHSIVLSLARMNRVIEVDPVDNSIIAQAGCILAQIQTTAEDVGRHFPLSLGAEGSCQIGGNASTNAGGTGVLRYGNMRDQVLGIEVVLPDGRIWNGLRTLRKNNSGYDLKHMFLGSEGTLGIITTLALRMVPQPDPAVTALLHIDNVAGVARLAARMLDRFGPALGAMELMSAREIQLVLQFHPDFSFPFPSEQGWFVILDISQPAGADTAAALQEVLAEIGEDVALQDAIIAQNESQRDAIWRVRHGVTHAHRSYGTGMSHDVAVPLARVPDFLDQADRIVRCDFPRAEIAVVAHLGDGNIHYNVIYAKDLWDQVEDRPAQKARVYRAIYDLAAGMGGTFSAEHGIGSLHLNEMTSYKDSIELELMRRIKTAFDPSGVMNPGRLLPCCPAMQGRNDE